MNRYEKMTRKQLEEIICSYMTFSNYTREEMEEEIIANFEKNNPNSTEKEGFKYALKLMSDELIKERFKDCYFSNLEKDELIEEILRNEKLKNFTREEFKKQIEEIEEKYEDLSKYVERIICCLFIFATVAIYWLNMSNNMNIERLERKVYKLEKVIEEQNEQMKNLEENIDIMVDEFVFEE